MGKSKKYIGMDIMPDGRIRKRFTVEGKRYAAYGASPKEAEENATKKRIAIINGTYRGNSSITFGEYFHAWLKRKMGIAREKTIFDYKNVFHVHIEGTALERRKVQKIERLELIEFQQSIAKEKTPKTANRVLLVIHTVLKSAMMDEIITRNPAANIPRLKDKSKRPARETIHRALEPQEIAAFMEAAKGAWYYNAFRLMLATGLRAGECGALEWSDIDYKKGVIRVRRTITRDNKGRWAIGETTKTEHSRRDIPINAEIRHVLADQRNFYNDIHGGKVETMRARVFESSCGGLVQAGSLNQAIQRIIRGTGIKHFSVHALRDTFATMAIKSGMQPNTLMEIMGHSDISTTMNIYVHVYDEEKKKAMDVLRVISM